MTAVPFPVISAPGRKVQASGGRLINTYLEKLSATAGAKFLYWRVPGMVEFGTTTKTSFRGGILVGTLAYVLMGDKIFKFTSSGGAGTALTGTVGGTVPGYFARDNASTPNVVLVVPGEGAFVVSTTAVSAYPDADVGQPNGVTYLKGVFVFTYGNGQVSNSGINSTSISTLDFATAESKPDTLLRPIPLGNGQLLLCGDKSMEVWGGQNDTGFFFSYIATIPRGIAGPNCITGHEDGFGKGIFIVGDDNKVHKLNGYTPEPISTSDIDGLIEAVSDKSTIHLSCYTARGHAFVVVQTPDWCWEIDADLETWHERQSYQQDCWRGIPTINAFGKWLCGDRDTGNVFELRDDAHEEDGDPIRMRIETGPFGAFPNTLGVNAIELYLTKGVGVATGDDPEQTDPDVEIAISRNGGQDWSAGRVVKVGRQSITDGRVRSHIWGQAEVQGVRWRFDFSARVPFGFMGADMHADDLKKAASTVAA